MNTLTLESLKEHSYLIGKNLDLVQAGGGNISLKMDSKIWIKSSGKRLIDAKNHEIFVSLDISSVTLERIMASDDFSNIVIRNFELGYELKPSIETNFHIMINQPLVTHLHSLGALIIGVTSKTDEIVTLLKSKFSIAIIQYARPGIAIAQLINQCNSRDESILILRNHGVIFSAQTFEDLNMKIDQFEKMTKETFLSFKKDSNLPSWIEILTGGVLTPDEAVYLGPQPFVYSENISEAHITINQNGEVHFPSNFAEDKLALAHFYIKLSKVIEYRTKVDYLSAIEVHELLNWEKEISRSKMAK